MTARLPSLRGTAAERVAQHTLAALWLGILPALSAGLVLRYLVPDVGGAWAGAVNVLGHRFGLYFGVALFLVFSALVRYWRYWLPGGRYCTRLPAHLVSGERDARRLAEWESHAELYERLRSRQLRSRLERTLGGQELGELYRWTTDLGAALEGGDARRALDARAAINSLAASALGWKRRRDAVSIVATAAACAAAMLAFRARVGEPYRVVGNSMLPTLEPADLLFGNKVAYASSSRRVPARGDVVVFRTDSVALGPGTEGLPPILVKRVVGLPGDLVAMHGTSPVINGWQVPSCDAGEFVYVVADPVGGAFHASRGRLKVEFLDDRSYLTVQSASSPRLVEDEYRVKPNEVFVLGDNRGNSVDSRSYGGGHGGGVPVEAVKGRAEWFLLGSHRGGDMDMSRMLRPVDSLQGRLRLEGLDTRPAEEGIARCLQSRPTDTRPPPEKPNDLARNSGG
jgi:signal peptidase I